MVRGSAISVVIPVKDDATNLSRCLGLLVSQLGPVDEIIVVDNGSSDDSAGIAASFGATVVHVDGGGIPAASAAGYDNASRPIIARLDADCVPGDDWLRSIRQSMSSSGVDAITGWAHFYDGPRPLRSVLMALYLGSYYSALFPALGHLPVFGSNCAFRRVAWLEIRDAVHRDDDGVHDDLDLAFHLGPQRSIRFERTLSMGISMRPFFDASAFGVRLRRGSHSIAVHWPAQLPWLRWYRRVADRLRRRS